MSGPPIPVDTTDLTPKWFSKILKTTVETITLQQLGEKDSVSGSIYRAKLGYTFTTHNLPESIVLKMPRPRNQRSPYLLKAYIREVKFYQKLAPHVGIPVPKLIYADVDTKTSDYILALEDFTDSSNVRNKTGATKDQAYGLIKNMAKLHAKHWQDPELPQYKFLNNLENILEMQKTGLLTNVPTFLNRYKHFIEPEEIAFIDALPEIFLDSVSPLLDSPQTLVHNDYAMKNILMLNRSGESSFVLVDWANVSQGPGVRDLSFFIGTSVRPANRSRYEFDFLRYYWGSLREGGVSDYSYDQLVDDYRRAVVIDLARIVFFGGREFNNSMYDSIVKQEIQGRTGSVKELDLHSLL